MTETICAVCGDTAHWRWSDTHGVAVCGTCGLPYRLFHYDGDTRVDKPPSIAVNEEWLPLALDYWRETKQRVFPGVFDMGIFRSRGERTYSGATEDEMREFDTWMEERKDRWPAPVARTEPAPSPEGSFHGLPIEVRVNEQPAKDAYEVQEENNALRVKLAGETTARMLHAAHAKQITDELQAETQARTAAERERDELLRGKPTRAILEAQLAASERAREHLRTALEPFALFAEKWDAKPLKGIADEFYAIHAGEDGAALRLTDCRRAHAALRGAPAGPSTEPAGGIVQVMPPFQHPGYVIRKAQSRPIIDNEPAPLAGAVPESQGEPKQRLVTLPGSAPPLAGAEAQGTKKCVIGEYCQKHGFIHGGEAEELRSRVETILDQIDHEGDDAADELDRALRIMLDDIDARDSAAFLEAQPTPSEDA